MSILRTVSLIILFFQLNTLLIAQEEGEPPRRIAEYIKEAESALLNFDLQEAEKLYLIALEKKPNYAPAMRGLATIYSLRGEFKPAVKLLEKIVKKNPRFSRAIYHDIAVAHYRYGNYDASIEYFNKYDSLQAVPHTEFGFNGNRELMYEVEYRAKLSENLRACQIAKDSIFNKNVRSISNLGAPINTASNEYFPFLTNDQNTLFFTRQHRQFGDENLFYSQKTGENWFPSIYIDSTFNTPVNEGMASFTRDGRQMFFTACQRWNVQGTCDIRKADVTATRINSTTILNGAVNSHRWESQACISCDGMALYFASNRDGGFGSTDLYVSYLQEDGSWGEAINLGININTDKDEESPFITNDGKTLFFSSTGHLGMGEQDLFMSRLQEDGNWGEAINLGPPINTAYRELGFFLTADGRTGLFSSNRPAGEGKMDIYQFHLSQELSSEAITFVEGFVKDSITKAPVQTILYPLNHRPVPTDEQGRFFLCLKAAEDFDFKINETTYYQMYKRIQQIPVWDNKTFFPMEILLQPFPKAPEKPDTLKLDLDLYFEFDVASLADSSQNQLALFLKNIDPEKIAGIQIIGYCDYYGTDAYNLKLSKKRAENVATRLEELNYLKGKIKATVEIEGKGEIKDNAPRARNRRVRLSIFMY